MIKPVYLCNQETNVVYLILVSRIERQTVLTFLTDFVQTSQFLPGCLYRSFMFVLKSLKTISHLTDRDIGIGSNFNSGEYNHFVL